MGTTRVAAVKSLKDQLSQTAKRFSGGEVIQMIEQLFDYPHEPHPQQHEIDWIKLRDDFFAELTRKEKGIPDFNCMPHNVFDWFKQRPEFFQPTGERDKEMAIEFAEWCQCNIKEYFRGGTYSLLPQPGNDTSITFTIHELFELFLSQKQKI